MIDINKLERRSCPDCTIGLSWCYRRPCWGTVNDFKKIIDNGFAEYLMIDYYIDKKINNGKLFYFLSGANSELNMCSKADFNPMGRCMLLKEDKCLVHCFKPILGAYTCCKSNDLAEINNEIKHVILKTWLTEEGKNLIEYWKNLVNYIDKPDYNNFSLLELQTLLTNFLNP